MNASSYDIRTNSDTSSLYAERGWNKSDPVPVHIYAIRQSMVDNHPSRDYQMLHTTHQ